MSPGGSEQVAKRDGSIHATIFLRTITLWPPSSNPFLLTTELEYITPPRFLRKSRGFPVNVRPFSWREL